MRQISGNKLFVKALKEEDVEVLFGYPGACTIDISDELYKQSGIDVILPRHEQALVHEADAYARTTGKVGVGKIIRLEIRSAPIIRIPNTIVTAVNTAIRVLYRFARTPVARAKVSSKVIAKILL